ncbi:MAG TPA: 16S rRNA (guanine(966)-N(2))-methyltransferase RsmD [Acidimicrobiales bacterium]|nr:16S rRNA (guanine(966)-N(2))-methyltransferase RsmD [Acidimicrobiales bacterium]
MRVVGGSARGRRLRAPAGRATRPTADRVREAIFDMLDTMLELEGATVVDLFAGSGALGIEALSRGAARVVFVERAAPALAAIRANLESTGLAGARAEVVRADALGWSAGAQHVTLALADPPYAFDDWASLLATLDAELAVLESDRPLEVPVTWEIVRHKRYGDTLVTVVRHAPAAEDGRRDQKGSP